MRSENKVIIDWLSFTSRIHTVSDIMDMLGMRELPWITTKGAHGYKSRMYYSCISIHFDGNGGTVWLEMSGQGCRTFETLGTGDYGFLFSVIDNNPGNVHITRLDIAYDDISRPDEPGEICPGILDIKQVAEDTRNQNFVSKSTEWQVVESSKGISIGIGSMKSDVYIRIYDKAAERGYSDGTHWVRVELQLRDDRALQFTKISLPVGEAFAGVLLNYLRYVVPEETDSNKWRWGLTDYWYDLVLDASRISIYVKPGMEYNVLKCENYVINQAGNAIDSLIELYGVDKFLEKLKSRSTKPNPKYQNMVDSARRQHEVLSDHVQDVLFSDGKTAIDSMNRPIHYDTVYDFDEHGNKLT